MDLHLHVSDLGDPLISFCLACTHYVKHLHIDDFWLSISLRMIGGSWLMSDAFLYCSSVDLVSNKYSITIKYNSISVADYGIHMYITGSSELVCLDIVRYRN